MYRERPVGHPSANYVIGGWVITERLGRWIHFLAATVYENARPRLRKAMLKGMKLLNDLSMH